MNNTQQNYPHYNRRNPYRSRLTRRILLQYLLSLAGYLAGLIFLTAVCWTLASSIIWQPYDPLYRILNFIKNYLLLFLGGLFLIGWSILTYYFISKPLRYLDEIVAASERLAAPDAEPILLSEGIKHVQDRLNLFREQAFRNAVIAKESEQRKNDLIVYLAHDLKTPLTSVIGYLTLLRDEPEISPALRARYTGIALDKAERLEELINEFFDITRFNLTTLTLEPERTNFSRMLEQIVSEFEPVLSEKELIWETEIAPDIELLCDRNKMERVLDNLIRNAVNYSYPKTAIFIGMHPVESGVEILVRNHGRTIPPDKLSRIFEQFFRVDSSRASATGGAGLGLAIAREIVELHGGQICAESAQEQILFTVRLPSVCRMPS